MELSKSKSSYLRRAGIFAAWLVGTLAALLLMLRLTLAYHDTSIEECGVKAKAKSAESLWESAQKTLPVGFSRGEVQDCWREPFLRWIAHAFWAVVDRESYAPMFTATLLTLPRQESPEVLSWRFLRCAGTFGWQCHEEEQYQGVVVQVRTQGGLRPVAILFDQGVEASFVRKIALNAYESIDLGGENIPDCRNPGEYIDSQSMLDSLNASISRYPLPGMRVYLHAGDAWLMVGRQTVVDPSEDLTEKLVLKYSLSVSGASGSISRPECGNTTLYAHM